MMREKEKSVRNISGVKEMLRPWLRLTMLTALLVFAMGVLGPLGLRLPGYCEMDRFIAENGLKATAIYYTDLPEFARAEQVIRDGMRFGPQDVRDRH